MPTSDASKTRDRFSLDLPIPFRLMRLHSWNDTDLSDLPSSRVAIQAGSIRAITKKSVINHDCAKSVARIKQAIIVTKKTESGEETR